MSIQIVPEKGTRLRFGEAWRARTAVLGAAGLCRLSPATMARVLTKLNRSQPPASEEVCARARAAVCTVSLRCRSPKGCVLRSVATTLLCRTMGGSATWCTGFALAPFRAHAWVEAGGRAIGEPDEIADYVVVLATSSSRMDGEPHV